VLAARLSRIGRRQVLGGLFRSAFGLASDPSAAETLPRKAGQLWYVDNDRSGTGDGKSWMTAWPGFADISWDHVNPGDTVCISGGSNGKTYNEALIIAASGKAGAPITITAGVDPGHAGMVTIDAGGVRRACVLASSQNHLTIQNLTLQNNANGANLIIKGASAGTVVQGITSHSGMGSGGGRDCRCFDIRDCIASPGTIAVILQNCTADTPASTTSQTDALWTSGNSGVLVQHNRFIVANTDPTGHSDCIQSYTDISVTYRCNLLAHPNGGANNHGFIVSDVQTGGTLYFYNNIVVMGSTPGLAAGRPEAAIFRQTTKSDHDGIVKIWNNTIYGGSSGYHCGSTAGAVPAADEFKNNVVCMSPNSVAAYELQAGYLAAPSNTDYNLAYNTGAGLAIYGRGGGIGAARSTTSRIRGRLYFEVQLVEGIRSANTLVGIGNAKASLTRRPGVSADSFGWEWDNGAVYFDGIHDNRKRVTAGSSDVVAFAFDLIARKFWINNLTRHSGWNSAAPTSQNPGAGTGGYPIPPGLFGPYCIMISVGEAGDGVILNAGAMPFVGAVPAGFSAWGAATSLNSAEIGTRATLTAPIAVISGGRFESWAGWTALGYDKHGLHADPLFADPTALNFQLGKASPAKKAGLVLPDVEIDYRGRERPRNVPYSLGALQG
jgi:hypothetical protein